MRAWSEGRPEAALIASPSAAFALVDVLGQGALCALREVVAIGATTAAALQTLGVPARVSSRATFEAAAATLLESLNAEEARS